MPKWTMCKTSGCQDHRAVCRGCGRLDNDHCEEHVLPAKMIKVGKYFYCAKTRRCSGFEKCVTGGECTTVLCTGCEAMKILKPAIMCGKYGCEKSTTRCANCGPFAIKPGITSDKTNWYDLLCPEHFAAAKGQAICGGCGAYSPKKQYACKCCEKSLCETCHPSTRVDVSPITLYGSGLSIYSEARLCDDCMAGHTEDDVQDSWRRCGNFICATHTTAD